MFIILYFLSFIRALPDTLLSVCIVWTCASVTLCRDLFMWWLLMFPSFCCFVFFLMIRRPPRSTLDRSSAASDVYKRQLVSISVVTLGTGTWPLVDQIERQHGSVTVVRRCLDLSELLACAHTGMARVAPVSYTHLRAHETVLDLVCRLLLVNKKTHNKHNTSIVTS